MKADVKTQRIQEFVNGSFRFKGIRKMIFFMTLPALADPYQEFYWHLLRWPTVALHLFMLWIMMSPVKRQKEIQLYFAVFGIYGSLGYLLVQYKLMHDNVGLTTPAFPYMLIGVYLLSALLFIEATPRLVDEGGFSNKTPGYSNGVMPFLMFVGICCLAYPVAGFLYGNIQAAIFPVCLFGLMEAFLLMGVVISYRYILIRRHPEWYKWKEQKLQV